MSRAGEGLLAWLLRLRGAPTFSPGEQSFSDYFSWQFSSSERLFSVFPNWNVRGKEVLEIGCGTGGRAAYLAAAGAKRVVGIDINSDEIRFANELRQELHPELDGKVEYLACQEDTPLELGLAYGYTRPGGKCYSSCYGYYHKSGSHTGLLPFVNVFFSDERVY